VVILNTHVDAFMNMRLVFLSAVPEENLVAPEKPDMVS
jgi:hypothetical protein